MTGKEFAEAFFEFNDVHGGPDSEESNQWLAETFDKAVLEARRDGEAPKFLCLDCRPKPAANQPQEGFCVVCQKHFERGE